MNDLGARDDGAGCGRALWEIDNRDGVGNGKYGTTMALMLLPFWTDGCIASMEGLYFEASGTTPVPLPHRRGDVRRASNPVRQLRYTNNEADVGIEHIHDLGIRYVMVTTAEAVAEADARPGADEGRHERAVAHLRVRRRGDRRAARRPAGRGQRPRRRSARVLPGDRHVVVPAPGRVGGDAGRRRPGHLAAHRRRHRREPPRAPGPGHRRVRRPAVVHVADG